MKNTNGLFLVIIFSCLIVQLTNSQKLNYDPGQLTRPYQFDENKQFEFALQSLVQRYSKGFIYYENVMKKNFRFIKDKDGYFINIYNDKSNPKTLIDRIKLQRYVNKNGIEFLETPESEFKRIIDENRMIQQNVSPTLSSGNFIVQKRGILYDREILHFNGLYDYGKILDREFCLKYLKYTESFDPSPLFVDCVDGIIIPYMTPTGKQSGKVIFVDKGWSVIKFGERDSLANGVKTYGSLGHGINNLSAPTGIDVGRYSESGGSKIYPLYISDQNNNRLITVDFNLNNTSGYSYFDDGSFAVIDSTLSGIFDIAYWQSRDTTDSNDKLWVSELDGGYTTITSLSITGSTVQKVRGFRNPSDNQDYLFLAGTEPRLSTYEYGIYNTLVFVDNMRNFIVPCPLDSTGNATLHSIGGGDYVIQAQEIIVFPENYRVNSVHVHKTSPATDDWPYLWVTTGLSPPFDNSASMIHLFKMNKSSRWQYMASTNQPENTDHTFSGLLNQVTVNDYYDVFSIEHWTDTHGLRRFMPFADIRDAVVSNYCNDSLDFLKWEAVFTNDCFVKLTAERENGKDNWETVEIKSVDFINYNANEVTFYREAGWTQDPIIIELDLPFKDYVLGNRVRINGKLYPEYDPLGSGPYTEAVYTVDVERSCLATPGGCPFLYVRNVSEEYQVDNNLLHRSEFSDSEVDITDMYKLQVEPYVNGRGDIEVSIIENETDITHINYVKLWAVDYPIEKKLAITENNQIVLFDSSEVSASDSVVLNGSNLTSYLNYHSPGLMPIEGGNGDSLYAHFSYPPPKLSQNNAEKYSKKGINQLNGEKNKGSQAKGSNITLQGDLLIQKPIAFITRVGNLIDIIPSAKDTAGLLTATSINSNPFAGIFARRELPSMVVLPMFFANDLTDNLKIKWQDDYNIKYVGVAYLDYGNFTMTELPIHTAIDQRIDTSYDVESNVLTHDTLYAIVNQSQYLKLEFDGSSLPKLSEDNRREYIIEVNGYYIAGTKDLLSKFTNQLPVNYSLFQNYPNPFNPTTTINYELPKNTQVTLVIYDILGREVIRLANNEFKQAGRHTVEFDARNYASGVYFYRIEAGDFVQSKKMVLIK